MVSVTTFDVHKFAGDGYAIARKESVHNAYEENDQWSVIRGIGTWADLRFHFDDLPSWMVEEIISNYGSSEDWPGDGEDFESPFSIPDDPDSELDRRVGASMIEDLPDEIFEQFDVVKETTHDGALGFIWDEDLESVITVLRAAGHTVESAPGG